MEIGSILATALGTGVATAVFNQSIAWIREHKTEARKSKKAAQFLAVQLIVPLEQLRSTVLKQYQNKICSNNLTDSPEQPMARFLNCRLIPKAITGPTWILFLFRER